MEKSELLGAPVFYEVVEDVTLAEWENVLPLIHLRSRHKKEISLPQDLKVRVVFPCKGGERFEYFSVNGLLFDEDPNRPYERAFLWLSGYMGGKKVFAFMTVDMGNFANCKIYFSPLPLGVAGKPCLSSRQDFYDAVAWAAAWLFEECDRTGVDIVNVLDFAKAFRVKHGYCLLDSTVAGKMVDALIMEPVGNSQAFLKRLMTRERFEEVFGVPLPKVGGDSTPVRVKHEDWLPARLRREKIAPFLRVAKVALSKWASDGDAALAFWAGTVAEAEAIDYISGDRICEGIRRIFQWFSARNCRQRLGSSKDRHWIEELEPLFAQLKLIMIEVDALAPLVY